MWQKYDGDFSRESPGAAAYFPYYFLICIYGKCECIFQASWDYVKELGKRGAAHVHMLMSVCDVRKLRECWNKGGVSVKPLYSDGDYSAIARYFIKYSADTEKVEGKLIGKRWSASRNLKQPIVIKKIVKANTFNQRIPEKKGYVLDPTSVAEGYTEFGYRYFSYTMRRIEKGG